MKNRDKILKDVIKANRRAGREIDLANSTGWTSVHKTHKSIKNYTRKDKHTKKFLI